MTNSKPAVDPSIYADAVVVGFDGSTDSQRAVRWAHADAGRRGARLVVLRAWSIKSAPRPKDADHGYVPSEDEYAAAVRDAVAAELQGVLGEEGPVEVVPLAVHRPAEDALVEASRHAVLTVVGARGNGLARWIGSTSMSIVREAGGPVVVVPQRGERGSDVRPE